MQRFLMMPNRRFLAIAGVVLIVGYLASLFYLHTRPEKNGYGAEHDFVTVITGSHCLLDHCDPYDSPTLVREFKKMGGYAPRQRWKPEWPVYPPSTLLLLFPLALVPWSVFSVVYILICFVSVTAAYVWLYLHCRGYQDWRSLLPFPILLADWSVAWAIQLGQPVLLAGSTLVLSILAIESASMPVLGALLLTVSVLVKPQGAYLCVAYFLLRKRTRLPALAACLLTGMMALAGTMAYYARLGSLAFLGHLSANLKVAMQPGGDADFSLRNVDSAGYLNIQAFLARFSIDYSLCNYLTYALCAFILIALIYVCRRTGSLHTRPYTILAILVMVELLVSYHRLYDHILMLSAIPGLYEIKARSDKSYYLLVCGLLVYHFSQFHGLKIHGLGPFSSGPPVELLFAGVCLYSLWREKQLPPTGARRTEERIPAALST